jgi:hypothetical protein
MASPLSRLAWPLAALAAGAFLVGLALHGERPEPGMVRFVAAGLMTQVTPDEAREVEIVTPDGTWRFRKQATWEEVAPPRPAPAGFASRIDAALRLLRDSGPSRVLTPEEVKGTSPTDYGLDRGATQVTVRSAAGTTFVVRFGGPNPLGLGRYARVDGMDGIPILPGFVADAWEQVVRGAPG